MQKNCTLYTFINTDNDYTGKVLPYFMLHNNSTLGENYKYLMYKYNFPHKFGILMLTTFVGRYNLRLDKMRTNKQTVAI